jgi:ketosteroid isomerase-like protein
MRQPLVRNLFDRRLLAAAALGAAAIFARPAAAAEDVSALLKAKTQAFSDAVQVGDAAVIDALLDPNVVFFNEGGDQATKRDMVSGAQPPPKGVAGVITVTDWRCQVYGDTVVASFIDDLMQDFHGQPFHARYQSVETWRKSAGQWRMIGSETIALYDDPRPATLSASVLDEYVGVYQAAPDLQFTFIRDGERLLASVNGGPLTPQLAEIKDVVFTPGRAGVRKIFQRDANGAVVGLVYREGHDIYLKRL